MSTQNIYYSVKKTTYKYSMHDMTVNKKKIDDSLFQENKKETADSASTGPLSLG